MRLISLALATTLSIGTVFAQTQICFRSRGESSYPLPPEGVSSSVTGDFNRDGLQDLLVTNVNSRLLSFYAGQSNGSFQPPTTVDLRYTPFSMETGDFNSDGAIDLVVTRYDQIDAALYLNDGGKFSTPRNISTGPANSPIFYSTSRKIVTGDFDNNGTLDLAFSAANSMITISLNDGAGNFSFLGQDDLIDFPSDIATGDFNEDGNLDMVMTMFDFDTSIPNYLIFRYGNGDGTFQPFKKTILKKQNVMSLDVGNFNNDHHTDLAIGIETTGSQTFVSIFTGDGKGNFAQADLPGGLVYDLIAGDFDQDNIEDIAAMMSSDKLRLYKGKGDGTFTITDYVTGHKGYRVLYGKFGEPASPAFAALNHGSRDIYMLRQNPDGLFGYTQDVYTGAGSAPQKLVAVDIDGDGWMDLATADNNNQASIFRNFNGTLTKVDTALAGGEPRSIRAADLDHDGDMDLVTVNRIGRSVTVLANNGNGQFIRRAASRVGGAFDLAIADFNEDGNLDIVTANLSADNISLLKGKGDNTFLNAVTFRTGINTMAIECADINHDGHQDVLIARSLQEGFITVLLGNGKGSFSPAQDFSVGSGPNDLEVADLNNDGVADVAVVNANDNSVSVLLGIGNGQFHPQKQFPTTKWPYALTVADFNEDAIADIAISNWSENTVAIMVGTGNGDFVKGKDFYNGNGPRSLVSADMDHDGHIDIAALAQGTETISLMLNTTAFVSIVGEPLNCAGQGITLKSTNNNARLYQWSTGADGTQDLVVRQNGSYSLIATDEAGHCRSVSKPIVLAANAPGTPLSQLPIPVTLCPGSSYQFRIGENGGYTYEWAYTGENARFTSTANEAALAAQTGVTAGSLSVTATNACGTSEPLQIDLTATPLPIKPTAFTNSTAVVCKGTSGVVYEVAVQSDLSYAWHYSKPGVTLPGNTNSVLADFGPTASDGVLRVVSMNACGISAPLEMNITVHTPATLLDEIAGKRDPCLGTSGHEYSIAKNAELAYTWSYSGQGVLLLPNANVVTADIGAAATGGTLSVQGANACGITNMLTLDLHAHTRPVPPSEIIGSAEICRQSALERYTISEITDADNYTWAYSGANAQVESVGRSASITFEETSASGILSVFASNSCGTGEPQELAIVILNAPSTPQFIVSTTQLCAGASEVAYTVAPSTEPDTPEVLYSWIYTGTGATIHGNTNAVLLDFDRNATEGSLRVRATNMCNTSEFIDLPIAIRPTPNAPVLTWDESTNVLNSDGAPVTLWYRNGALLPEETENTLTITISGTYQAAAIASSCPSELSEPLNIVITGIENTQEHKSIIYPNPVTHSFTWAGNGTFNGKATLTIFNAHGTKVQTTTFIVRGHPTCFIEVSSLGSGLYFFEVAVDGTQTSTGKFIKQ